MKTKIALPAGICLVVLAATAVGCAPEPVPAQGSAAQGGGSDVCRPLAAMDRALTKAKTLSAFSTPNDLSRLQADLDQAMLDTTAAADPALDLDALGDEVDKFLIFAERVPPGLTIGSSAALLQGQAVGLGKAYAAVVAAAGCPA
jgi:hypothetical protein